MYEEQRAQSGGYPLTNEELQELRALANLPDDQIDFSDIPERTYEPSQEIRAQEAMPLEDHTVTLRVDAEVAAWLETEGRRNPNINLVLKRAAHRSRQIHPPAHSSFEKAS